MEEEYIDISYSGKKKRNYSTDEIYTKIISELKKSKLDKTWTCQKENDCISIDFKDNISDVFYLDFNKNDFSGYCRVKYNGGVEITTLERLLDILFMLQQKFSKLEVIDDYSICESYLKNKKIKIELIEVKIEEIEKLRAIYEEGYKDYRIFILNYIARSLNLKSYKDLYINRGVTDFQSRSKVEEVYEDIVRNIFETYLYEATIYKENCRFCDNGFYDKNNIAEYKALGSAGFDSYAFSSGMLMLIGNKEDYFSFGVRDAQVKRLYRDKIYGMLEKEKDDFEQCIVAYRFFISILKYTGFKFIGKADKFSNDSIHFREVRYRNDIFTCEDALNYYLSNNKI